MQTAKRTVYILVLESAILHENELTRAHVYNHSAVSRETAKTSTKAGRPDDALPPLCIKKIHWNSHFVVLDDNIESSPFSELVMQASPSKIVG